MTVGMAVSNDQNLDCPSQVEKLDPWIQQFWLQLKYEWDLSPQMSKLMIVPPYSASSTAVIYIYRENWIFYLFTLCSDMFPPSNSLPASTTFPLSRYSSFLLMPLSRLQISTFLIPPLIWSVYIKLFLNFSCTLNSLVSFIVFLIQMPGPPYISSRIFLTYLNI